MAELFKTGRFIGASDIASNSLSVKDGDLVDKVGGFIVKATDDTGVIGIAAGEQSFASNNQTVGKEKIEYIKFDDYTEVKVAITGGTVTQANEGAGFDLTSTGTVDGTTAGTGDTLFLRKFVSTTEGIFGSRK